LVSWKKLKVIIKDAHQNPFYGWIVKALAESGLTVPRKMTW
jgi:hypothetical protein